MLLKGVSTPRTFPFSPQIDHITHSHSDHLIIQGLNQVCMQQHVIKTDNKNCNTDSKTITIYVHGNSG